MQARSRVQSVGRQRPPQWVNAPTHHLDSSGQEASGRATHGVRASHASVVVPLSLLRSPLPPATTRVPSPALNALPSKLAKEIVLVWLFQLVWSAGQRSRTGPPVVTRKTHASVMRSVPSVRAVSVPSCGGTTARGPHAPPDDGDAPGTTKDVEVAIATDGVGLGALGSTRAPDQSQPPATIPASSHPPTSPSVWPLVRRVLRP